MFNLRPVSAPAAQNAQSWALSARCKLFEDALGEHLIDFCMTGHRLRNLRLRILIPIVLPAVPDKNCASFFDLPDKVAAFHANSSCA